MAMIIGRLVLIGRKTGPLAQLVVSPKGCCQLQAKACTQSTG